MFKKYKNLIVFSLFFVISFIITFFTKIDSDVMWNFGFSYNTAKGLMMYKDFNMVISPLYPFVTGLLMKILGNNMIAFYLINSFYITSVAFLSFKLNKKTCILTLPFILFSCLPNYNTLGILFCLLLVYLEKERKNDYLIGSIIALSFLTKINVGFILCLPSLYYIKDFKKIYKRFIGFIIPNIVVILFFLIKNNLKNYIDYVFLGILDFAGNNLQISFFIIVIPIIIYFLIKSFIKEKDIVYLYAIFFIGIIYPVMNELHVIMAITPGIIILITKKDYILERFNFIGIISCLFLLVMLIPNVKNYEFKYDDNIFKYRYIQSNYIDNANSLKHHFNSNFSNVCFMSYDNYIYKFLLNLPINKYDILLYGNMGYKGTDKLINYIKEKPKNTYFVFDSIITGAQYNNEGLKFVQNNYNLVLIMGDFYIYQK